MNIQYIFLLCLCCTTSYTFSTLDALRGRIEKVSSLNGKGVLINTNAVKFPGIKYGDEQEENRYVDVYVLESSNEEPKPVLVLFGDITEAEICGDMEARQNLIIVVISELDINNGDDERHLREMITALKWLNKNIYWFGGDQKFFTVVSVDKKMSYYLALLEQLPNSATLFQRIVVQDCDWQLQDMTGTKNHQYLNNLLPAMTGRY